MYCHFNVYTKYIHFHRSVSHRDIHVNILIGIGVAENVQYQLRSFTTSCIFCTRSNNNSFNFQLSRQSHSRGCKKISYKLNNLTREPYHSPLQPDRCSGCSHSNHGRRSRLDDYVMIFAFHNFHDTKYV